MENQNPGRSNKDRAALHIIRGIISENGLPTNPENGKIIPPEPGKQYRIYEGTSGNTGISLGLVSNYFGLKARIYLNDDLAAEKVRQFHS